MVMDATKREENVKTWHFQAQIRWVLAATIVGLLGGAILISALTRATDHPFLCSIAASRGNDLTTAPIQLHAIVHYATSKVVPQQNLAEISVTFDVLRRRSPCNFLVYGLGHDSLMWASLNPLGRTLFLEEDPKWVESVLRDAPNLRAHAVHYRTQLSQADSLMSHYKSEPECSPSRAKIRGESRCKLLLTELPAEVYDKEWDLIMIDAPKGYYPEAPGRMAAIFTAAVMARNRRSPGTTHVFLHDVDRRVEKLYAEKFLCRKYLVKSEGRLWHFEIPAVSNVMGGDDGGFC